MAITKEELQNYLKEKLVGQKYESYGLISTVGKEVINFLESKGIDCKYIKAREDRNYKQTVFIRVEDPGYIEYRYASILYVEVKKQKVATHYSPWLSGSYCDWVFKDFSIHLYGAADSEDDASTIEESIEKAQERLDEWRNRSNGIRAKAIELYKSLLEKETEEDARKIIKDLHEHYYTIKNEVTE